MSDQAVSIDDPMWGRFQFFTRDRSLMSPTDLASVETLRGLTPGTEGVALLSPRKRDPGEVAAEAQALASLRGLKSLVLGNVCGVMWEAVASLPNLERLVVYRPRVTELGRMACEGTLRDLVLVEPKELTTLEGVGRFRRLQRLGLEELPKVSDFAPVAELGGLEGLELGLQLSKFNASGIQKVDSLAFLMRLGSLKHLVLTMQQVADGDYTVLGGLTGLSRLFFTPNLPREEIARLSARLRRTACTHFRSSQPEQNRECAVHGKGTHRRFTGMRQPTFCVLCKPERAQKLDAEWDAWAGSAA